MKKYLLSMLITAVLCFGLNAVSLSDIDAHLFRGHLNSGVLHSLSTLYKSVKRNKPPKPPKPPKPHKKPRKPPKPHKPHKPHHHP